MKNTDPNVNPKDLAQSFERGLRKLINDYTPPNFTAGERMDLYNAMMEVSMKAIYNKLLKTNPHLAEKLSEMMRDGKVVN